MGININKKRMKCFDCQLYACPGCYWSTTRRCNTCQTVNINVFNYEAISKLPIKVLRSYSAFYIVYVFLILISYG